MSTICNYCGTHVEQGANFCTSCGTGITYVQTHKKSVFSGFLGKALGLIIVVAVYGVVNLLFFGAQELYHKNDTEELERLSASLDKEKLEIEQLEKQIVEYEKDLEDMKYNMDQYERLGQISKYNSLVSPYNELLAKSKQEFSVYQGYIASFNTKVEQYNKLNTDSGTRYFIIPVPRANH